MQGWYVHKNDLNEVFQEMRNWVDEADKARPNAGLHTMLHEVLSQLEKHLEDKMKFIKTREIQ